MPYINVNSNRQRLCESGKLPLVYCNSSALNGVKHLEQHNMRYDFNLNGIGQRMDAVIYSMIVAVFYAGIILIILLTNSHRFRTNRRKRTKFTSKMTANGVFINSSKTRNKCLFSIEKQLIVNTNKELTVLDSSDKYPETLI